MYYVLTETVHLSVIRKQMILDAGFLEMLVVFSL